MGRRAASLWWSNDQSCENAKREAFCPKDIIERLDFVERFMGKYTLNVNGAPRSVDVESDKPLLGASVDTPNPPTTSGHLKTGHHRRAEA
jgi:hypothetical protein